jgi:hypothetical protein
MKTCRLFVECNRQVVKFLLFPQPCRRRWFCHQPTRQLVLVILICHSIRCHTDMSRRKSSSVSIPLPADVSARIADLEHENDVLRRQLEKIGKLDGLAMERSSRPSSRDRREQSISRDRSTGSGRKEVDRLRMENLELVDRLREQADDLMAMKQERESLLLTIQLLQDDLTTSERHRHRLTPT